MNGDKSREAIFIFLWFHQQINENAKINLFSVATVSFSHPDPPKDSTIQQLFSNHFSVYHVYFRSVIKIAESFGQLSISSLFSIVIIGDWLKFLPENRRLSLNRDKVLQMYSIMDFRTENSFEFLNFGNFCVKFDKIRI